MLRTADAPTQSFERAEADAALVAGGRAAADLHGAAADGLGTAPAHGSHRPSPHSTISNVLKRNGLSQPPRVARALAVFAARWVAAKAADDRQRLGVHEGTARCASSSLSVASAT
jgi:hypothetical protein